MVGYNFTLHDLRSLYIDEFYDYYQAVVYNYEQRGEMEKGTYDSLIKQDMTPAERIRHGFMSLFANKQG